MTETPEQAAARIARGPSPSSFVEAGGADASGAIESPAAAPFDPLRLCIFATIAILGWLFGPLAVVVFAGVGFAGCALLRWLDRRAMRLYTWCT